MCDSTPIDVNSSLLFDTGPQHIKSDDVTIYAPLLMWDDVSTLTLHIIPMSPSPTMSATFHDFVGCRTFSLCIYYLIDMLPLLPSTMLLNVMVVLWMRDLGFDYSIIDSHLTQIHSFGMVVSYTYSQWHMRVSPFMFYF